MNIQTGGKVSGVYGIKVLRNAGTDKERLEDFGESKNMLLDGFFDRFASGNLDPSKWYFFVGSGTTPAVATQTQLVNKIGDFKYANALKNDNVKVGSDYIASSTGEGKWELGDIVGNISEVGVRMGDRIGDTVDSRALIVDDQGNPTTITVTAEDKLEISYTLKCVIPIEQHVSVTDIGGVQTTCTLERLAVLDSGRNGIGSVIELSEKLYITGTKTVTNNPESTSTSGFVNINGTGLTLTGSNLGIGSRKQTFKLSTAIGNLGGGGIGGVGITQEYYSFHHSVVRFDPQIPKDSTKTLTLNFDFTLARA